MYSKLNIGIQYKLFDKPKLSDRILVMANTVLLNKYCNMLLKKKILKGDTKKINKPRYS